MVTTRSRSYNTWIVLTAHNQSANILVNRAFFSNLCVDFLCQNGPAVLVDKQYGVCTKGTYLLFILFVPNILTVKLTVCTRRIFVQKDIIFGRWQNNVQVMRYCKYYIRCQILWSDVYYHDGQFSTFYLHSIEVD